VENPMKALEIFGSALGKS